MFADLSRTAALLAARAKFTAICVGNTERREVKSSPLPPPPPSPPPSLYIDATKRPPVTSPRPNLSFPPLEVLNLLPLTLFHCHILPGEGEKVIILTLVVKTGHLYRLERSIQTSGVIGPV